MNYCLGSQSTQQPTQYWLQAQDHTGEARGYAPYVQGNPQYPVYRDVIEYGARNDGSGNQTYALQNAINTDGMGGSREGKGSTNMPAEVFLPGGVYTLGGTLTLRLGTIIVGDPLNRPIIRASPDFMGTSLINGQDPASGHPETVFMVAMRNVILDTTAIDGSYTFTALQWGIAQGCSLSNVDINMPQGSSGHIGIHLNGGSTIAVTDVVRYLPLAIGNFQILTSLDNQWRWHRHAKLKPTSQLQKHPLQRLPDWLRRYRRFYRRSTSGNLFELRIGH